MAKRKVPAAQKATLDLPASFGNVGIGDEKARISILIDRKHITATKAETFFCGSRSEVRVFVDPNASGDQPGQEKMDFAKAEHKLESVADVLRFSVGSKTIGATLTFAIASVDLETLCKFAKKGGRLVMNRIGEADAKDDAGDEEEDEDAEDDKKDAAGA